MLIGENKNGKIQFSECCINDEIQKKKFKYEGTYYGEKKLKKMFSMSNFEFKNFLTKNFDNLKIKNGLYEINIFKELIRPYLKEQEIIFTLELFEHLSQTLFDHILRNLKIINDTYNTFMKRKIEGLSFTYHDIEEYSKLPTFLCKQINTKVISTFVTLKKKFSEKFGRTFSKSKGAREYDKFHSRQKLDFEYEHNKKEEFMYLNNGILNIFGLSLDLEKGFMVSNQQILNTTKDNQQTFLIKYDNKNGKINIVMKVKKFQFDNKKL